MYSYNSIYHEDCIQGMKKLPDQSVDMIIADPPYNLSKGNIWSMENKEGLKGFGGNWGKVMEDWDNMELSEYFTFTLTWLKECKRVLKPTGSIWVFGSYHNIGIINFAFQLLEIEIINEVIWYKRNAFPNLSGRRLTASHETILWGHVGNSKKRLYKFNYLDLRDGEFPEDLLKSKGKQMRTVWDIPNNKRKEELAYGKHPTQKPERVIERIMIAGTDVGDTVLIPFAGSGTECVVAKKYNRNFLGFEINDDYIDLANRRLKNLIKNTEQMKLNI